MLANVGPRVPPFRSLIWDVFWRPIDKSRAYPSHYEPAGGLVHAAHGSRGQIVQLDRVSRPLWVVCRRRPCGKGFLVATQGVGCSHVSGLLMRCFWTAGPDGIRGSGPNRLRALEAPCPKRVLPIPGTTRVASRQFHPAKRVGFYGCVAKAVMATQSSWMLGSSPVGRAAPRRYGRSCWPRRRPQLWLACVP